MGNQQARTDYHWSYTDEPHATRRREILDKHPEVKRLFGYDPATKYKVTAWVLAQFTMAWFLRDQSWWMIVTFAYCFGGFASHALVLAMHEISHNLAFPTALPNRLLGIFANTATFVPHFSMFQKYHMEHHQFQGHVGVDSDIPSPWEGNFFTNSLLKVCWVFFQPLFYIVRPLFLKPKIPGLWDGINWTVVIFLDILLCQYWGLKSGAYLFLSIFLGSGLHPVAGHFIAEHYVFLKGQETYSYYGPLNLICFNVGYHNEHHDFPRIPGSRLPELRSMIPQYYDKLSCYDSWSKVIWRYITDPTVGPYSRVMRAPKRAPNTADNDKSS